LPNSLWLIVKEGGDGRSKLGAEVNVEFDPSRALMFDAQTEERMR
tara:strand:- start:113 stop:247 length:135 start_codon:yes stop_codon:yes gene_type:complete